MNILIRYISPSIMRTSNEGNSLLDLVQNISPDSEDEVNFTDHSLYYNDQNYKECIARSKGALRILNLNCGGLNAKFDNLKIFLSECNLILRFRCMLLRYRRRTLTLFQMFNISSCPVTHWFMIYHLARINTFGGVAIYVHDSFSFNRLDTVAFTQ